MTAVASKNVKLYGTEEAVPPMQTLSVGLLSASLDGGNLRYIKVGGVEAIRAIAFIVRDKNWGTYVPAIRDLLVQEDPDGFLVRYEATCKDDEQELVYRAEIEGRPDGSVRFAARGTPTTAFTTNRTGFIVLHGVDGIAGQPATVTHTDGKVTEAPFPDLISPSQPFFGIRSIRHQVSPGVFVTCTMEGDAYEMEDQRNWTDASFKTYIRPLAKPWPYTLAAGESFEQEIGLTVEGAPAAADGDSSRITLRVDGSQEAPVPEISLAVEPETIQASLDAAAVVRAARPKFLTCYYDPGAGHGTAELETYARLARELRARVILEAVLPLKDADGVFTDDPAVLGHEAAHLAAAVREASLDIQMLSVSPAAYHTSYQPDGQWPAVPPLEDVYQAVRAVFPMSVIGGGMHSYFTELNRKRPPADALDFITHTTCPIVHAGDDVSVMESLEALTSVMKSAQAMAPGKPYWVGPSAIGMRFNPYGAAPMDNPSGGRVPMARLDPRQRGLFNAAWTLGYIAYAVRARAQGVCLNAPAGPFGIAYAKTDWSQPWFDEMGGRAVVYPVFHVLAAMAGPSAAAARPVTSSAPGAVQGLALRGRGGDQIWLANLTDDTQTLSIEGMSGSAVIHVADEDSFTQVCTDPESFGADSLPVDLSALTLKAYAVARIDVRN